MIGKENIVVRTADLAVLVLAMCALACARTLEGKKIVDGHGFAPPSTRILRRYADEMKNALLTHGRNRR